MQGFFISAARPAVVQLKKAARFLTTTGLTSKHAICRIPSTLYYILLYRLIICLNGSEKKKQKAKKKTKKKKTKKKNTF